MLTKVLEQKWIIRLFGLALLISPFLNIFVSGEAALDPGQHLTWPLFWSFVRGVPIAFKALEVASFVIGGLMLRGSVSAWRYLLALLGAYIVLQFVHLGHNLRSDKTAWFFIGINVLVFFFIADQLVLKPREVESPITNPVAAPKPALEPAAAAPALSVVTPVGPLATVTNDISAAITAMPTKRVSRKNIVIALDGVGNFARLVDISPSGLRVRCLNELPAGISTRLLLVTLGGVDLQLRCSRQLDNEIFFEWVDLGQPQIRSLNKWLRAISA